MRRDLLALILVVLLHCLLFESGLGGSDGWGYFANVESLVEDRDLDLANNLSPKGKEGAEGAVGTSEGRLGGMPHPTKPGRVVNSYPLVKAFLDMPFYLLGRAGGAVLGGVRLPSMAGTPYEGIPPRRLFCVLGLVFASNVWAAAAVAFSFLALLRIGFSRPAAFAASLLAFFASPMPFYAVNGMSHSAATMVSAALLLAWVSGAGPLGLGALVSLAVGLRYGSILLVPGIGLLLLAQGREGILRRLCFYVLGLASLAWIEALRNFLEYGSPTASVYGSVTESLILWPVPVLNLFTAFRHGILWWSPLVAFAMWGLCRKPAEAPKRSAVAMAWVLYLGHSLLASVGGSFHAGSGFSQRYLCESMPAWALGVAFLLEGAGKGRLLGFSLLAGWNYLLFLLTAARLCRYSAEAGGTRLGWVLSDYLYVFDERMGIGEVLKRILHATVPGQFFR